MFWTALLLLGLAIALWRLSQRHSDEIYRSLGSLCALIFLIAGLAATPILLRGVILLGVIVYPVCLSQSGFRRNPICSRLCLLRSQCQSLFKNTLPPEQ